MRLGKVEDGASCNVPTRGLIAELSHQELASDRHTGEELEGPTCLLVTGAGTREG